jgi:hypothetical protein
LRPSIFIKIVTERSHLDLETSLDRMCMGVEELNFRLARIEIALRKQNLRIRLREPVILIKDVSLDHCSQEGQGHIRP